MTFGLIRDGVDDAREIGPGKRIAAAALHHCIVDRNDGDDVGAAPRHAARASVHKSVSVASTRSRKRRWAVGVGEIDAASPQCGEEEAAQDVSASSVHAAVSKSDLVKISIAIGRFSRGHIVGVSLSSCPRFIDPAFIHRAVTGQASIAQVAIRLNLVAPSLAISDVDARLA